jgi:hypothetical protein
MKKVNYVMCTMLLAASCFVACDKDNPETPFLHVPGTIIDAAVFE